MANLGALLHPPQVLVCFVYLVERNQLVEQNKPDQPDEPNQPDQPSA
jgi:hypothetical protein